MTSAASPSTSGSSYKPFWSEQVEAASQTLWLPSSADLSTLRCCDPTLHPSWLSSVKFQASSPIATLPTVLSFPLNTTATDAEPSPSSPPTKKAKTIAATTTTTTTSEKKPPAERCKLIKVYPDEDQRKILYRWFGTARWTYNACVKAVSDDPCLRTKGKLREKLVNNDNYKGHPTLSWVLETPYEVRDGAMNDLLEAYASNFARRKNKPDHTFSVKFRSRRYAQQESIFIRARDYKSGAFYVRFFGKAPLRSSEPLPTSLKHDARLVWVHKTNEFYLAVPCSKPVLHVVSPPCNKIIALDPGVRTFQTGYDPQGVVFKFGSKDHKKLELLAWSIDSMQSMLDTGSKRKEDPISFKNKTERAEKEEQEQEDQQLPHFPDTTETKSIQTQTRKKGRQQQQRQRQPKAPPKQQRTQAQIKRRARKRKTQAKRLSHRRRQALVPPGSPLPGDAREAKKKRWRVARAQTRMRQRIRNLVADTHKKVAKFLVSNYNLILLPAFETQDMLTTTKKRKNGKRKIRRCTARSMATWSHYKFQQRLLQKAETAPWGCRVEIVREDYTSVTCGRCGNVKWDLGGAELYSCSAAAGGCNLTIDRDINGARNVLLRNAASLGINWSSSSTSGKNQN